jgi:hypothetical protein
LKIKGEDKTFDSGFVAALYFREYLEMAKDMDFNNMLPEDYNKMFGLMARAFQNQFTADQLWNGIGVDQLDNVVVEFIQFLNGKPGNAAK